MSFRLQAASLGAAQAEQPRMLQIEHEAELAPQHTETGQRLSPQAEQGSVYGTPESQGINLSNITVLIFLCCTFTVTHTFAWSQLGLVDTGKVLHLCCDLFYGTALTSVC